MLLSKVLQDATSKLRAAGIPDPQLDAEWLIAWLLNCRRTDLHLNHDQELTQEFILRYNDRIEERTTRRPLQYIIGTQNFFGREFIVNESTLIPRPETEELTQHVINSIGDKPWHVLDIGTGSGCIAITLALECPQTDCTAVDTEVAALIIARDNARTFAVDKKIRFLAADCFPDEEHDLPYDLIVSNPPYIAESDWETLQPEVADYEPRTALVGGSDGLDIIKKIITGCEFRLKSGGQLWLECGHNQAEQISDIIKESGLFSAHVIHSDLQGVQRFINAQRT